MATVQDILNILNNIAADSLAESWDNVGLLIGNPQQRVSSVLVALDPACQLIEQAKERSAELIITHHPAIFHPLKSLRTDQPSGNFIHSALLAGINVIGCHTNLDATVRGVSDVLAGSLGLTSIQPLVPDRNGSEGCGLGRIGDLASPLSPDDFVDRLQRVLAAPWLLEAGTRPEKIGRVAVCGGSCSDLAESAHRQKADVFVTAEVKHAAARWAEEAGFWLIDGGHFATEYPAMEVLQQMIRESLMQTGISMQVSTALQHPPLKLIPITY